jgi:hypothetical protein
MSKTAVTTTREQNVIALSGGALIMANIEDRLVETMHEIARAQTDEIMSLLRSMSIWNRQNSFDAVAILNERVARLEKLLLAAEREESLQ